MEIITLFVSAPHWLMLPSYNISLPFCRMPEEALINEDFCLLARKASSARSEVYQDMHELRTGRA